MYDEMSTSAGGETTTIEKPKTRAEKIAEWRAINQKQYENACHEANCTCTPTRAQILIIDNYNIPPID